MKFGYARVSTGEQKLDLQLDALSAHGVDRARVYVDVGSGRDFSRPELQAALKAMREGDEFVVWRLDRVGRSTKDLLAIVELLGSRQIGFVSLHERIETISATGKLMFTVFAAISAFERDLLAERTKAGLASARARGRTGGRPPALKSTDLKLARSMLSDNKVSVTDVAKHFKVGRNTLYRALRKEQ